MTHRPGPADWISWLLFLLAAPAAYFCFALNRFSWNVEYIALASAILVLLAAIALRWTTLSPTSRVIRVLTIGGSSLVIAAALWNFAYAAHVAAPKADISRGEFRKIRNSRHWPIYGGFHFDGAGRAIPAVLAMGGTVAFLIYSRRRNHPIDGRFLTALATLQILTMLAMGYAENRLQAPLEFQGFRVGVARFDKFGIDSYLREYVYLQHTLGTYDPHYPPGFTLLMILEHRSHLYGFVAELALLLTALTVFPLSRLVREIGGDENSQRWTLGLYSTCAGLLIFPTLTPIVMMVFPCTLLLLTIAIAMRAQSFALSISIGVAMGIVAAIYAFFSFSIVMLGVFVAAFLVLTLLFNRATLREIPMRLVLLFASAAAIFAAIYLSLKFASGFNWWACLRESRKNLVHSNGNYYDSLARFILRATGNPLAYLLSCGFALAIPILSPGRVTLYQDKSAPSRAWLYATPIALLLASVLGMGRLETERVWTFFTPVLCVASGFWLARRERETNLYLLVMIGCGLWTCAQEILYHHY